MLSLMSSFAFAAPILTTTTIDYLDYAFYDNIGPKEYYALECYEQRIREMAEGGIRQINLRTNCMGVALHPSKVLRRYGEDGRWHYSEPAGSKRLIETLKRYDPVAETIRLGHKYGLKVWCWENICDEIGLGKTQEDEIPTEYRELYEAASDEVKNSIKNTASYLLFENQYDVNNFWESTGLMEASSRKLMHENFINNMPKIGEINESVDLPYSKEFISTIADMAKAYN